MTAGVSGLGRIIELCVAAAANRIGDAVAVGNALVHGALLRKVSGRRHSILRENVYQNCNRKASHCNR